MVVFQPPVTKVLILRACAFVLEVSGTVFFVGHMWVQLSFSILAGLSFRFIFLFLNTAVCRMLSDEVAHPFVTM